MNRQPAGELHGFEAAHDLTEQIREGLAVVASDQRGELLTMAINQLPIGEEDLAAGDQGHVAPGGVCPPGGDNGGIDLRGTAARHASDDVAGGRVVNGSCTLRLNLDGTAVDPVAQDRDLGGGGHEPYFFRGSGAGRGVGRDRGALCR